jgi:uncharacterized coiled-coil DUF342 family protein
MYEEREDLREELKDMTARYINVKEERDKYKQYAGEVRRDIENIDKIVKENVERAVRAKEK